MEHILDVLATLGAMMVVMAIAGAYARAAIQALDGSGIGGISQGARALEPSP
jgi:hypothetical protein